ncbi:MAG TPA: hypothetical protein VGP68_25005 [Gemmataceae bacterium]|jgi:hypothetical protein|nr:hypothetical protein [Gemmataceae bacterium]
MADQPEQASATTTTILGLSTSELAGLSVEELKGNKTAITMVMHYYKQLSDENTSLRNDLNTLKTYVDGYRTVRHDAKTGAILLAVSSIGIGFGVNLLTSGTTWPGVATFLPGIALLVAGLYFSLRAQA